MLHKGHGELNFTLQLLAVNIQHCKTSNNTQTYNAQEFSYLCPHKKLAAEAAKIKKFAKRNSSTVRLWMTTYSPPSAYTITLVVERKPMKSQQSTLRLTTLQHRCCSRLRIQRSVLAFNYQIENKPVFLIDACRVYSTKSNLDAPSTYPGTAYEIEQKIEREKTYGFVCDQLLLFPQEPFQLLAQMLSLLEMCKTIVW